MAGIKKKEKKKKQLLEAAREMFDRYGAQKVTLEDIARSAGMAVSSLYYYFPSKEQLLREVVVLEHQEVLAEIRLRVEAAGEPERQLLEVSRVIFERLKKLARLPGMSRTERLHMLGEIERAAERFKQAVVEIIEWIVYEGVGQGVFEVERPDLVARLFVAGLRGVFESVLDGEIPTDDLESMQKMGELLVRGLRKR